MKGPATERDLIIAKHLANLESGVHTGCEWTRPLPIEDSEVVFAGKRLSDLFEESRREASQGSYLVSLCAKVKWL